MEGDKKPGSRLKRLFDLTRKITIEFGGKEKKIPSYIIRYSIFGELAAATLYATGTINPVTNPILFWGAVAGAPVVGSVFGLADYQMQKLRRQQNPPQE